MIYLNKDEIRCPRCGSKMRPAIAMNKGFSTNWLRCEKEHCQTYFNTTIPLPHQRLQYQDPARYMLIAGGYGTGKTHFDKEDKLKHGLITPNGRTLFGAPTMPQLESTLKNDFEESTPLDFISYYNSQKNYFTLENNHEYLYRSFDDVNKLKSLNLSSAVILEASDAPFEALTRLKDRLRNTAATKQKKDENGKLLYKKILDPITKRHRMIPDLEADWRKITMESNPGPGWIKSEVLLKSARVLFYQPEETFEDYNYYQDQIDRSLSTHIVATSANYYLPPNYEAEQTAGKPKWWVDRYFKGSFAYSTGLVYPEFKENIVKRFAIPNDWKRLIGYDYGIRDQSFFVFVAIDPKEKIAYVYDTLILTDNSVKHIVQEYRKRLAAIPDGALLTTPVMDARSMRVRQAFNVDKTLGDLFRDEGVLFDPAQMNMDARMFKTGTLFKLGQLKIFDTETELIRQLEGYKFPDKQIGKHKANEDKPIDKDNHGPNALEFVVMELPVNLANLNFSAYNKDGKIVKALEIESRRPVQTFDPFKMPVANKDYYDNPLIGGSYGLDESDYNSGGMQYADIGDIFASDEDDNY